MSWLSRKIPQHVASTARRPTQLNQTPQRPVRALISNGVKQGCVPAPTLFNIFFSMMLKHATQDLDDEDCVYVSTTWTAVCSIYGARTPTPRPRKGRPQMTLPLLPTQNELCSKSKPPLQMLLSSLALRLASRRIPPPRKNTTRPLSPSATQS